MVSLGAVLEQFPDDVIFYVTDPRTGIQRRMKWPPTISEVIEACEERQDFLEKMRQPKAQAVARPPIVLLRDRQPGSLAKMFVPKGHARYDEMIAWTEKEDPVWWRYGKSSDGRDGIWVALYAWERRPSPTRLTRASTTEEGK